MLKRDKRDVHNETLYRAVTLKREAINVEARTVDLAFSSEEPVQRYSYIEILDHQPQSVRLGRMQGGGPVLVDHDPADHVGVVEQVSIDSDRKGRAVVRFGKSARADEIFQDITDGIRMHVSVGYRIHKEDAVGLDTPNPTYRAIDWEPLEISIVSVPADASVGIGRAADTQAALDADAIERSKTKPNADELPAKTNRSPTMETEEQKTARLAAEAAARTAQDKTARDAGENAALTRVNDLLAAGEQYAKHGGRELASRAIKEGKDAKWLADALLLKMSTDPSPSSPDLGLTGTETKRYSVMRALNALVEFSKGNVRAWENAGFERECHEELVKRIGPAANGGIYVPYEIQKRPAANADGQRDLTSGVGSAGGFLVATDNLAGSFIDLLRARAKVAQLGAIMLPGLKGNVTIPKLSAAATHYWLSTEGTPATESQPTLGQLALTPKTVGAYTEISRLLMMQSNPSADMLVMNDLAKVIALAIDLAALNGSGAAGQPLGIIGTAGIGAVSGTSLNYAGIVEFETDVAAANADVDTMAYLCTPQVRGLLKGRERTGSTVGNYVWGGMNGEKSLNGYRAEVSTQVPSANMLFGDFSQIVVAEWGVLELALNPYANFPAGIIGLRAFQTCDVGVRQAGAFSLAATIT